MILFAIKSLKLFQLWQIGNWAVPEYDSEGLSGAKPFTSFPGGNMQERISNNFKKYFILGVPQIWDHCVKKL